jgi:putative ABC transport system substrate-binding protein
MFRRAFPFVLILLAFTLSACSQPDEAAESHYKIGLVTNNPNGLKNVQGFRDGMAKLGYIEGKNTTFLSTGESVKGDELDTALENLVNEGVDLIFTAGTPTGVAAHRITKGTGIPVVFGVIADPIAAGVMEDLNRPGGNITGVMLSQNQARRLELLLEIAPHIKRIFILYNPEDAAATSALEQVQRRASDLGIEIVSVEGHNDGEVSAALSNLPPEIDAIFLVPDSVVNAHIDNIVALAIDRKLPISGPSNTQVEDGALTAYGIIHHQVGEHAARIADQILKGAKPGELPVETAEFFMAINLQTADAIGLEIPYSILEQAKIIIRTDGNE